MRLIAGTSLKGMDNYTDSIRITEALVRAGYSSDELTGILGGNYLRFLGRAMP
jgi:microsomal dipeptidase-like Zn-dependent dipeptidase